MISGGVSLENSFEVVGRESSSEKKMSFSRLPHPSVEHKVGSIF